VRLLDAEPVADPERNGEVGADVEEVVLDTRQRLSQSLRERAVCEHHPDRRVELIHRAEGADAAVQLRHARAVAERGLSSVTRARVNTCEPDRLVALTT
jgi:hypothetical protein